MEFRIAGTFTVSLAKLIDKEQTAMQITAFNQQLTPARPDR